jgi:hypothetical protein
VDAAEELQDEEDQEDVFYEVLIDEFTNCYERSNDESTRMKLSR